MNWKTLSIPKKIAVGFGVTILGIATVAVLNFTGVGGIVTNASTVINGNKLKGVLVQREVDHLNWAMELNKLLTDESVTELTVQTDDHQCGFGKFLYGEGRNHAEALVPSLAPLFSQIEAPHRELHKSAIKIGSVFKQADMNLPAFLAEKETDHLQWMATIDALFIHNKKRLDITIDPRQCGLGKWLYGDGARKAAETAPQMAALLDNLKAEHKLLHESAIEIQNRYQQIHPGLLEQLMISLDAHRKWANTVASEIMNNEQALSVQTDPKQCVFGRFLKSDQAKEWAGDFPELRNALNQTKAPHAELHESALAISGALSTGSLGKAQKIYSQKTLPALEDVTESFDRAIQAEQKRMTAHNDAKHYFSTTVNDAYRKTHGALIKVKEQSVAMLKGMQEANRIYASETEAALKKTQGLLHQLNSETEKNIMTDVAMLNAAQNTKRNSTIVGIIGIILSILLAVIIARGITTVLKRISSHMGDASDQVAAAAGQVSGASQSLAEGASEQAASIEETSASLEEMSSMTKQNADNANQADTLMKDANTIVVKANGAMAELNDSMDDISKASQETSKIIKTIDEIAFQTNLLALNAAVEAARAGEAGAGFAVVADEVRNLAMRAAEAAKNTADLIEGTVKKINDGGELVTRTNEAFSEVAGSTSKVAELISEITAASSEQAEGIDQINRAIVELDKVTQQNAANAEESASASEEMSAQAIQMRESVSELIRMVGGNDSGHKSMSPDMNNQMISHNTDYQKQSTTSPQRTNSLSRSSASPEKILPMTDDDDFADF